MGDSPVLPLRIVLIDAAGDFLVAEVQDHLDEVDVPVIMVTGLSADLPAWLSFEYPLTILVVDKAANGELLSLDVDGVRGSLDS